MSAHAHRAEEIDAMKHQTDTLSRDKVIFTIDYAQNGLGNRSCGPDVFPGYRLEPKTVRYAYTLMHITSQTRAFRYAYSRDILPELCAEEKNAQQEVSVGEYRDPSDEDVRRAAGFRS